MMIIINHIFKMVTILLILAWWSSFWNRSLVNHKRSFWYSSYVNHMRPTIIIKFKFEWPNVMKIVGLILVSPWISDAGKKMKWVCKPRASSSKHENACKYYAICYAYSFSIFMNMSTLMNMVKRILIHLIIILTLQHWSYILISVFLALIHVSKSPQKWFDLQFIFTLCKDSILYLLCVPAQPVCAAKKRPRKVKIVPAQIICGAKCGLVMHSVLISDVAVK